uniref:RING-type domain-containing protein n=2 Tax=Tetraodon nigroviridis TaxID=99883 RepID=H3CPP0_TETNG
MDFSQSEQARILQEDLTCPVCLEVYRNPHLLSCGHNFCKTCLDNVKRQGERGRFRCPECRERHRCNAPVLKNLKLASISDNYRQRHRGGAVCSGNSKPMEIQSSSPVQQIRGTSAVPCDYCPSVAETASNTSATSNGQGDCDKEEATTASGASSAAALTFAVKTCLKCEVSMCPEHVKPHLELPAFRGHPLTEPFNDFWKRKCPDHEEMYQ